MESLEDKIALLSTEMERLSLTNANKDSELEKGARNLSAVRQDY